MRCSTRSWPLRRDRGRRMCQAAPDAAAFVAAHAHRLRRRHRRRCSSPPSYAALDLGTNNCRLLIASADRRRLPRGRQLQPHRPSRRGPGQHRPARRGGDGPGAGRAARLRRQARPPPGAALARRRHRGLPPRRQRRRVPRPGEAETGLRLAHHLGPGGGGARDGILRSAARAGATVAPCCSTSAAAAPRSPGSACPGRSGRRGADRLRSRCRSGVVTLAERAGAACFTADGLRGGGRGGRRAPRAASTACTASAGRSATAACG